MSNKFLRIEAELFGQHKRFASSDHGDREQHVVADLGRLPRARAACEHDLLSHLFERRQAARKRLLAAAAHEGERARFRAADAARNGSIEEIEAGFFGGRVHGARGIDVDGRAVDQQSAFFRGARMPLSR